MPQPRKQYDKKQVLIPLYASCEGISTGKFAEILDCNPGTARRILVEMKQEGLVTETGIQTISYNASAKQNIKHNQAGLKNNLNLWKITEAGKKYVDTVSAPVESEPQIPIKKPSFGDGVECDYVQFLTVEERDLSVKLSKHLNQDNYTLLDHVGVAFQHFAVVYEVAPTSEYTKDLWNSFKKMLDDPVPETIATKLAEFQEKFSYIFYTQIDSDDRELIITRFVNIGVKFNVPKPSFIKPEIR
ncbi:MAG TPA: hypothetical protein VFE71_06365 [Bacteroidales bacterium]|nr:hypothetical protein [Bacteroidales bacterium]